MFKDKKLPFYYEPHVDYTDDNLYGDKIYPKYNKDILKIYQTNLDRDNEYKFDGNFSYYPFVHLRWKDFVSTFSEDNPFDARKFTNYELNYDPIRNKNDRRPFFNSEYLHNILKNIKKQKQKEMYKTNVPYYGDLSPIEILYTLFYNLFSFYRLHYSNDETKASDRTEKEQQQYENWAKQRAEEAKQDKFASQKKEEKKVFVVDVLYNKIKSTPSLKRVMVNYIKSGKAKELLDKRNKEKLKQQQKEETKDEKIAIIKEKKKQREPYALKKEAPWGFNPRGQKMKNDTKLIKKVFNALKTDKIIKSQKSSKPKLKTNYFDIKRRNELKLIRNKRPFIGDIVEPNIELYEKLISTNYAKIYNVIKYDYTKIYYELKQYIKFMVVNNKQKNYTNYDLNTINILFFINNQIEQKTYPFYFYPPYLQNYIALNGLYMLYKVIEDLFISFDTTIKDYITQHSKNEIEQYENKHYKYLKNISPAEKSLIHKKYHNFIPIKYDDDYLKYYSKKMKIDII